MQDVSKLGLKINPHILCCLGCIFFYLEQFSSCILRMRICHTCPSVKVQLSLIGLAAYFSNLTLFTILSLHDYMVICSLLLVFSIIFFPNHLQPYQNSTWLSPFTFQIICLQRLQQIRDSSNCYSLFFSTNDNTLPPHSLKRARTTSVS